MTISAADGDNQLGTPQDILEFPLLVRVVDATRGTSVRGVAVFWRVLSGAGATVTAIEAETDDIGAASARLRLGADTGTYRVEATAEGAVAGGATFSARAILAPVIGALSPAVAAAGATVTIDGTNFSATANDNVVLFDGLRGRILSASPTRMTVEVPACVLSREADVFVARGGVHSNAMSMTTQAGNITTLALAPGDHTTITDANQLACIATTPSNPGAQYLLVAQHAPERVGVPLRTELNTITGSTLPVTIPARQAAGAAPAALRWENLLRERERAMGGFTPLSGADAGHAQKAIPEIGERRTFKVLKSDRTTGTVTAEVRHISQRAIIYVDRQAPANGFTDLDLQRFGAQFDDPIYPVDVAVFGQPSDIDENDRIIILFTPAVNALTARNESGFIAGYFYGCDLLAASRCAETNLGEIFYGVVPDPQGEFSAPRSKDTVLRTVPGVLAHEFQHMIHYGVRGNTLDVLWLSEALAHAAEDLIGDEYLKRGDAVSASDFQRPNLVRAQFYLRLPAITTMVADGTPGTLEQRGASWLFLKYLMGHHGGTALLGRLTNATATGATNVVAATGRPWKTLLAEFAVATWADDSPEINIPIATRLSFTNMDVRAALASVSGGYPLDPLRFAFGDFQFVSEISAASQEFFLLTASGPAQRMHVAWTGVRGAPLSSADDAQLTILRIR